MSEPNAEGTASKRQRYLILLLLVAAAVQLVRVWNVRSNTGEMPFLSANDRSRWCSILALTTGSGFVIDDVLEIRDPLTKRRTWYSIDIVQHRGPDGKQHYYSSKPPLLSTLYAGVYWLVRSLTGATLTGQPFFVVRIILVLVNLIPLIGLWWLLSCWANESLSRSWQVHAMVIFATFGTFLSTFVITLNNHLPAALATALSLVCLVRILLKDDHRTGWFIGCGLATSFTATAELPAFSWVLMCGALLLLVDWRRTIAVYLPATLPVFVAFLGLNYLAHGTIRPAYSMRGLGQRIGEVEWSSVASESEPAATALADDGESPSMSPARLAEILCDWGFELGTRPIIRKARREGVWELWEEESQWKFALKWDDEQTKLGVYHWGDWYDFPTSYWKDDRKQGVDRGEPSRLKYAFHCLVGHHGVLSLTPFWCLSLIGAAVVVYQTPRSLWWSDRRFQIVVGIASTSIVVLLFYVWRPLEDRNYGGVTSGLRWMFWFVPLWFWLAVHGIRCMRYGWQWVIVTVFLVISIISATVPWNNPWTTPWLSHWIPL